MALSSTKARALGAMVQTAAARKEEAEEQWSQKASFILVGPLPSEKRAVIHSRTRRLAVHEHAILVNARASVEIRLSPSKEGKQMWKTA